MPSKINFPFLFTVLFSFRQPFSREKFVRSYSMTLYKIQAVSCLFKSCIARRGCSKCRCSVSTATKKNSDHRRLMFSPKEHYDGGKFVRKREIKKREKKKRFGPRGEVDRERICHEKNYLLGEGREEEKEIYAYWRITISRRLARIDIRPLKGLLERVVPTSWWQECLLENCTPPRRRVWWPIIP